MSATESLRRDHVLIKKILNALKTISILLNNGKQIPESILKPAIDFAINFINNCLMGWRKNHCFQPWKKRYA